MKKEGWLYFLLSHHRPSNLNRTIQIRIFGEELYLCARCSGVVMGFISSVWLVSFFSPLISFFLMIISPLPALFDRISQILNEREGDNKIRVITGFMLGISGGIFFSFLISGLSVFFFGSLAYFTTGFLSVLLVEHRTNLVKKYVSSKFKGQPPPWKDVNKFQEKKIKVDVI